MGHPQCIEVNPVTTIRCSLVVEHDGQHMNYGERDRSTRSGVAEWTDPEKPAASGEGVHVACCGICVKAGFNAGVEAERAEHFSNPAEKIITDLRAECEMLMRTEKALRARVDELEKLHEHDDECSRAMVECAAEWSTRLAAAEAERDRLQLQVDTTDGLFTEIARLRAALSELRDWCDGTMTDTKDSKRYLDLMDAADAALEREAEGEK